jgi:hypothetical protein
MLERIERLLTALDQRQPLDDDLSNWLRQAIIRHIRHGTSLDEALNIGGCRGKFLLERRDYCLVQAWRILERDDPTGSHWARSSRLEDLLKRFHAGRWRHLEMNPEPEVIDELSRWLLRALKTGRGVVGQRAIDNILKNAMGSNFNQMVVNFYHPNNKIDEPIMSTPRQPAGKRVTMKWRRPYGKKDTA